MKILYTEITQNLTQILVQETEKARQRGQKVYYIVPSSLSFEKEREVLEQKRLLQQLGNSEETAIFDSIVTRFKQLSYYFDKNSQLFSDKESLSQIGISLLFQEVLDSFSDEELPYFHSMKKSNGFVEKLIQLRSELITAQLTTEDLPDNPKNQELRLILDRFETIFAEKFNAEDIFQQFITKVKKGVFTESLQQSTFIIAGFTRFSAQEESLIRALNEQEADIIIGTYASERAIKQAKNVLGVYKSSVQMILRLTDIKPEMIYVSSQSVIEIYSQLTKIFEEENDFLLEKKAKILQKTQAIQLWEAENKHAEIERAAKDIRQQITRGKKFSDFTILVGNLAAYKLSLQHLFEIYDIPTFLAEEKAMSHHPLTVFLESLLAIKKYHYQRNDVLSFLKSQLYRPVNLSLQDIDRLESYLVSHQIHGKKQFSSPFTPDYFPDLPDQVQRKTETIEKLRVALFSETAPLTRFLNQKTQNFESWLVTFQNFLRDSKISETFLTLYETTQSPQEQDEHLQVWTLFQQLLKEMQSIYDSKKMTTTDFLEKIVFGMQSAKFRQVPANVDVVQVRDYELVEPRTNKIVYAIGLTQSDYPRLKRNSSLLDEKERLLINENQKNTEKYIEPLELNNQSKANFTTLSLLNAATEQLILSTPQILENQEDIRPNLFDLMMTRGDIILQRVRTANLDEQLIHIGNRHGTMTSLLKIERQLKKEESNPFWSGVFRLLEKSEPEMMRLLGQREKDISPQQLSTPVIQELYMERLQPSVSAFERFENCEYQYFLANSLHLHEIEPIDLASNVVGTYFHEVFQRLLEEKPYEDLFDETLTVALQQIDSKYVKLFERDALSQFTKLQLEKIIRQSAVLLKKALHAGFETQAVEQNFQKFDVAGVSLRGKIDRVDQFTEAIGAVDYKSGNLKFELSKAYDGTRLQLLTYLDVLKKTQSEPLWGALYLHLQNPVISLSALNSLSDLNATLLKEMRYTGLLDKSKEEEIKKQAFIESGKNNFYSETELSALLTHTEKIYQKGVQKLRSGEIGINPIVEKSGINRETLSVSGCTYCAFKSICRFEATRTTHFQMAREVGRKSRDEILEELHHA